MKQLLLLIWFIGVGIAFSQQPLPYDQTWEGFPFVSSYSKVIKVTITSYASAKDLKRKNHTIHETVFFDSLGRNIRNTANDDVGNRSSCWRYEENGCPVYISCDDGEELGNVVLHCRNGRIDTLVGELMVVKDFDSRGICSKEFRYRKSLNSKDYTLIDTVFYEYDVEGRYIGSYSSEFRYKVLYMEDRITVEKFVGGRISWTTEIKCGRYGLPLTMTSWSYDNRRRKPELFLSAACEYTFRDQ